MKYVKQFLIAALVFAIVDLIWLGILAWPVYKHFLSPFLRTPPHWGAASVFYVLFIIGMMIFAISPAITKKSLKYAAIFGAYYGFFTYMTYELTNLAVIQGWPIGIVPIDIIWGTILSGTVSTLTTMIVLKTQSNEY